MTPVVTPPNLSAHKPTRNCASRYDDPPKMPGSGNACAVCAGFGNSRQSRSSSVVRITGIAFGGGRMLITLQLRWHSVCSGLLEP